MFLKDTISQTDSWWQRNDFILLHVIITCSGLTLFQVFGPLDLFPLNDKLLQWDTGWYNHIRINGYQFSSSEQSNSGFFPLFPYIWKFIGLDVLGITLFNVVVTISGLVLLFREFEFKKHEILLGISFPSMFFLFVPYTESLFFLFSTLFLIGLKRNNYALVFCGLFMASMTRSTGAFFIPAIGYMVLLNVPPQTVFRSGVLLRLGTNLIPILTGIVMVIIWQWSETGVWFAYYKAQGAYWLREISLPTLPLSTWNYPQILWVDAFAFLVGLFAFWQVAKSVHLWIWRRNISSKKPELLVSEGFLCVVFISLLLLNPKNANSGLTEISGANRYVFASPFFLIFLLHLIRGNYKLQSIHLLIVPIIWLPFNIYSLHQMPIFFLLSIYVTGLLIVIRSNRSKLFWPLYIINIIAQLYLFSLFIDGKWVG